MHSVSGGPAVVVAVTGTAVIPAGIASAEPVEVAPTPGVIITRDVRFAPGTYAFPEGIDITIAADGIAVDGNGAVLHGPGVADALGSYLGVGVSATGHRTVTLRNSVRSPRHSCGCWASIKTPQHVTTSVLPNSSQYDGIQAVPTKRDPPAENSPNRTTNS